MRNRSDHDPSMIRPHTRPSRTRRTAEVDHRGSGTDFVWKNIGFRASAISQKRISCETSFKTPSATHPPAPLAIPFALRERSYSCKSQWNSIGNCIHQHHLQSHLHCGNDPTVANHNGILSDPAHARNTGRNPIYNAERRSEHCSSDHTRDRLAPVAPQSVDQTRFGDGLCMEKHRVSKQNLLSLKNAFRARLS